MRSPIPSHIAWHSHRNVLTSGPLDLISECNARSKLGSMRHSTQEQTNGRIFATRVKVNRNDDQGRDRLFLWWGHVIPAKPSAGTRGRRSRNGFNTILLPAVCCLQGEEQPCTEVGSLLALRMLCTFTDSLRDRGLWTWPVGWAPAPTLPLTALALGLTLRSLLKPSRPSRLLPPDVCMQAILSTRHASWTPDHVSDRPNAITTSARTPRYH